MEEFLQQYGYLALFVGTFLEGETILLAAGFLAFREYLELETVIAAAFCGTLLGDQLWFFLGRRYGRAYIMKKPAWKLQAERVEPLIRRHENLVIVSFRFLYGVRNVTPFLLGSSGTSWRKFFVLNTIGALVWAFSFAYLGYYFGAGIETMLDKVKKYEVWILCGLLLAGLIGWLAFIFREEKTLHDPAVLEHLQNPEEPERT